MTRARRRLVIQLVLASATIALYAPVIGYDFVTFDDNRYVTDNERVLQGLTFDNLGWALRTQHLGIWHPLTWLSHMLDVELFGTNPAGHHATAVLLHLAASLLLFQFLERATGAAGRSAFVAAVFALHPLHVESVAWISERKDVLSAGFFMLALCAYLGYCRRPGGARYALVLLAFTAGLMSKPSVVTLPFVLLLLDYWPLARLQRLWPRVVEKLPLFALSLAGSLVAFQSQRGWGTLADLAVAPLSLRIGNALVSYCAYVAKGLAPIRLAVLYPHPGELLSGWQVAVAASLLAVATLAAVGLARRAPFLLVGWLWFLGMLVPMIGLVQTGAQGMADRYSYLPLVGLALLLAWGVPALVPERRHWRGAVAAGGLVALAALAAVSSSQLRHWRDSVSLFEHALAVTRRAWPPLPDSPILRFQLGLAYAAAGRPEQALREYRASLALGEDTAPLHNNLANALVRLGRADEAIPHFERALALDPEHATAHFNLGIVLLGLGRAEQADPHTAVYLREHPGDARARLRLAAAQAAAGRVDAAIRSYEQAFAIRPGPASAQREAAALEWRSGRHRSAIERLSRTLDAVPDERMLRNDLAWMLATTPESALRDPARAVRLAERARAETPDDPGALDTLAAAYAAAQRFPEAVEASRRAVLLSGRDAPAAFRARLSLYEQGRPYLEPPGR